MATLNIFTSDRAIENWFAAMTTPLETRARHFKHCAQYSSGPCIYCDRKLDILNQDISFWKMRFDGEVNHFHKGAPADTLRCNSLQGIRNMWLSTKTRTQTHIAEWASLEASERVYDALEGLSAKEHLQKLKWKLEDKERRENIDIQIGKARGWT
ncbi:hypothetical protein N431DRAFT_494887 [Stipitochalara longipes BDJ]|nr:hypothetical protein N431DRAFT_494887 [Stipitochalara longipes BDJ]